MDTAWRHRERIRGWVEAMAVWVVGQRTVGWANHNNWAWMEHLIKWRLDSLKIDRILFFLYRPSGMDVDVVLVLVLVLDVLDVVVLDVVVLDVVVVDVVVLEVGPEVMPVIDRWRFTS